MKNYKESKIKNYIPLNFSSFIFFDNEKLPLSLEIVNNIRMIDYSFDGKEFQPLTLLTILYNSHYIDVAIDNTLSSFKIYGKDVDDSIIVKNKKELFRAIINNENKNIQIDNRIEDSMERTNLFIELCDYRDSVIKRYIRKKCYNKITQILNIIKNEQAIL